MVILISAVALGIAGALNQVRDRSRRWSAQAHFFWAAYGAVVAILTTVSFGTPLAVECAVYSALHAWLAWQQRKPRQRKPSKVTGVVRDLGHRLAVTSP